MQQQKEARERERAAHGTSETEPLTQSVCRQTARTGKSCAVPKSKPKNIKWNSQHTALSIRKSSSFACVFAWHEKDAAHVEQKKQFFLRPVSCGSFLTTQKCIFIEDARNAHCLWRCSSILSFFALVRAFGSAYAAPTCADKFMAKISGWIEMKCRRAEWCRQRRECIK